MVNEEKIKKEAKQIMDDFIKALDKIKEIPGEFGAEREQSTRKPEKKEETDFRKRMLKNAPRKDDDFVLMEKKSW